MNGNQRGERTSRSGLLADADRVAQLKRESTILPSIDLDARRLCDLELLLNGAFRPLGGFMTRAEYESVIARQRLPDGSPWPTPITLDVRSETAESLSQGDRVLLRDDEGAILAILTISEIWHPDPDAETGSESSRDHGRVCIGGAVEGIGLPIRHDHPDLRITPAELRVMLAGDGAREVWVLDQLEGVLQQAHQTIADAARKRSGRVLLHPMIGAAAATDLALHRRVKRYRAALSGYAAGSAKLVLLPLVRRGSDARDLLLRAIVHRNCGASHMLFDPGALDAQGHSRLHEVARLCEEELNLRLVAFDELGIAPPEPAGSQEWGHDAGAHVRGHRAANEQRWKDEHRGFTCFFTGLSGAGKSTLASALAAQLSMQNRAVTLLDGDVARKHLSSELTFSKEHRDLNIRRIGYVASEVTRHGGVAICAPIAPYRATRAAVREMVEAVGHFLEIHVATPISICAQRDPKGLYAKASAGLIKSFTGITDPYEIPEEPELVIDTSEQSIPEAVALILAELRRRGLLEREPGDAAGERTQRSAGAGAPE